MADDDYKNPWGDKDELGKIVKRALNNPMVPKKAPEEKKEDPKDIVARKAAEKAASIARGEIAAKKAAKAAKMLAAAEGREETVEPIKVVPVVEETKPEKSGDDKDSGKEKSGRDRDRDRDRNRDRGKRDRRDRSRERDRGRRDRSRERDRDRRNRDRDRRDRDRGRRRSRSRSPRHRRDRSRSRERRRRSRSQSSEDEDAEEEEEEDNSMFPSAAMVADRFVEVFGMSKRRIENIMECVGEEMVVTDLVNEETMVSSPKELEALLKENDSHKAEAAKRIFIESNRPTDPNYSLDFYSASKAPFSGKLFQKDCCVVLYKVKKGKIIQAWMGPDTDKIADDASTTEEQAYASKPFLQALDKMIRPGGLGGTKITKIYNNYAKIETWG
eukprot:m.175444 g.175444  ORF g.175444 m.175444 type:complete len:386 (+) comp15426_c0_seq1:13-1170(+)